MDQNLENVGEEVSSLVVKENQTKLYLQHCSLLYYLLSSVLQVQCSTPKESPAPASPEATQASPETTIDPESSDEGQDEDEEGLGDKDPFDGDVDELRSRQKLNSVAMISQLRVHPLCSSRFNIPLCRMVAMPMVRPTLSTDLAKLEQEFVHGYREGSSVFYVTLTDEDGNVHEVTDAEKESWGPIWGAKNDEFNSYLESIPELASFKNLKFFVCDGNHRLQAWLNHIQRLHKIEEEWHYLVDSILLDTKGKIGVVMQVMHNINK